MCRKKLPEVDLEEANMQLGKTGALILRLVIAKFRPAFRLGDNGGT